jgi:small subunit ribosomal protein S2
MKLPSILEMLKAGVHFGHQTSRWHPKMKQYIYGERNGVHIIDLEKAQETMKDTLDAVKNIAAQGKQIVFVTTKPQAREIVKAAAEDCGMPYLTDRWIGGFLTNFTEIKKLIRSYVELKEQQASGELEKYTKKEQVDIKKDLEKKDISLGGLSSVTKMPEAIFLPALQREKTAFTEANKTGVTVIGVADTNANPIRAHHIIPANDDAVKSIAMIVGLVAEAVKEGNAEFEKNKAATAKVEEKKA